MSQAGIIDVITNNPSIPTQFDADVGFAIPSFNVLDVKGVAAQGISTSGAGSTVTITAADATTISKGVAQFNPAMFSAALGVVSLIVPVTVANGGTGSTSFNVNGVVVSGATTTSPLTSLTMDNGELLIGSTGASPVVGTLTAGAGIAISNAAGSITITSTTGGFAWVRVAGVAQNIAVQTGYIPTNVAMTTFTLPATAAIGDGFQIAGEGTGLWRIATQAGQTIYCGVVTTTTGVGGYLTSTHRRDCVEVVCTNTDTEWTVVDFLGNLGAT